MEAGMESATIRVEIKAAEKHSLKISVAASFFLVRFFSVFSGGLNWLSANWVRGKWAWISAEVLSSVHQPFSRWELLVLRPTLPSLPLSAAHFIFSTSLCWLADSSALPSLQLPFPLVLYLFFFFWPVIFNFRHLWISEKDAWRLNDHTAVGPDTGAGPVPHLNIVPLCSEPAALRSQAKEFSFTVQGPSPSRLINFQRPGINLSQPPLPAP